MAPGMSSRRSTGSSAGYGFGWLGMELHIGPAPSESDSRRPWALGAGFKVGSAAAPDRVLEACNSGLIESGLIESPTFVLYGAGPRGQWFVTRYLPLSGIAAEPELDAQVRRLAAFVEEPWAVLSARPDFS
jgi:hypothetical protein